MSQHLPQRRQSSSQAATRSGGGGGGGGGRRRPRAAAAVQKATTTTQHTAVGVATTTAKAGTVVPTTAAAASSSSLLASPLLIFLFLSGIGVVVFFQMEAAFLKESSLTGISASPPDTSSSSFASTTRTRRRLVEATDRVYSHPRMSPVVVEKYKLVFFWVPKVACTVWTVLFHRMMGMDTSELTFDQIHDPEINPLRYLKDYDLDAADKMMQDPAWTRAIFVRNPHERLLSAYLDKGIGRNFTVLQKRCCPDTLSCMSTPETQTLEHFVALISGDVPTTNKENKKVKKKCVNQHWAPFTDRVESKYWEHVNFVGHFETLQADARTLLEKIGAWEEFGATGWGPNRTDSIFSPRSSDGRPHATDAVSQFETFYFGNPNTGSSGGGGTISARRDGGSTNELYQQVLAYYRTDYELGKLGLVPPPPPRGLEGEGKNLAW